MIPRECIAGSLAVVLVLVAGTGCVGPRPERPQPSYPDDFSHVDRVTPDRVQYPEEGRWWALFDNPELDRLLRRIETENPDYAESLRRVDEARLRADLNRAEARPSVGYGLRAERAKTPSSRSGFFSGQTRTSFEAPLTLRYEVDAWGRVRKAVEAGEAEAEAVAEDAATLLLSLQTELAARFLALQSVRSEKRVLEQAVAIRQKALDLSRARFQAGDVSEIDVSLAETELAEVTSQLVGLDRFRIELESGIAALVGEYPSALVLSPPPLPPEPPWVEPGLPGDLVRRRPDVRAAERRLDAQLARLGSARRLLFPSLVLDGSVGFESEQADDLGSSDSAAWRLAGGLQGPLYEGGANRNAAELADARYRQAEAVYRSVLVEAFRECETTLGAIRVLDDQIQAYRDTVNAARRTVELTQKQYAAGFVDAFEVVNAQRTLLRNEQALVRALGERYLALVDLIKALGGSW